MQTSRRKSEPIGAIIKAARVRRKLRAEDVAARCNVSRANVYLWEGGTYIMSKNLGTLSRELGVPLKKLIEANSKKSPGRLKLD